MPPPEMSFPQRSHTRKAALEYVGVPVDRRRDMPLSPEWAARLDRLEEHHRRDLRKFAGWCSARGIAPGEVTQEVFNRFFEFLQEQSIQHNYKERWRRPIRSWNKAIAIDELVTRRSKASSAAAPRG